MNELGFLGLVVLALDILAIYNTLSSRASGLANFLWTLLVLVLPVLGLIIWFFLGPRQSRAKV